MNDDNNIIDAVADLREVVSDGLSEAFEVADSGHNRTDWHCGFASAIDVELRNAGCVFDLYREIRSTSRSYNIDILLKVKKTPPDKVSEVMGIVKCLRRFTFCEYKSPGVSLTSYDINRLISLCLQYLCQEKISRDDVAAMFFVSRYPRVAFSELPEGWVVEEVELGVYIIRNANIVLTVVVIPQLSDASYKWLTSLRKNLSVQRLKSLIDESQQYTDNNSMAQLMSVLLEINVNKVKKGEIEMGSALMEFIEKSPHAVPMFQRRDAAAKTEAKAEAIILILSERFKTPSARLQKQIKKVNDIEKLDELIRFSATCVSLDEFTTAFN